MKKGWRNFVLCFPTLCYLQPLTSSTERTVSFPGYAHTKISSSDWTVIKYKTPWGGIQYEVYGSTANYTVFPGLPGSSPDTPPAFYCTCPAFAYSVLLSQNQIMVNTFSAPAIPLTCIFTYLQCKHLLATMVAEKLSKCVERNIQAHDLAALTARQHTM